MSIISKKSAVALAIASAAGLAASGANASPYDSVVLTGGDPTEAHDLGFVVDVCIADCVDNLGTGLEVDLLITIPNANPMLGSPGAPISPSAVDRYACRAPTGLANENSSFDASGNCVGVELTRNIGFFPAGGNILLEIPFSSVLQRYEFITDEEGRITSGFYLADFVFDDIPFLLYVNVDQRFFCGVGGGTFPNYDIAAVNTAVAAGNFDCLAGQTSNFFLSSAASPAEGSALSYNTCDVRDACGGSGKAVPVPALAAAALGLGLVGVTLLTGRKKKVQ